MEDLHFALKEMSEDTYRYHANADKNDFSKWVREVIGDETLAKNLDKVIKQNEAAAKVSTRVKSLKAKKK